ncbi:MAG: hypothetical protein ACK55I_19455, partial [bacterium]
LHPTGLDSLLEWLRTGGNVFVVVPLGEGHDFEIGCLQGSAITGKGKREENQRVAVVHDRRIAVVAQPGDAAQARDLHSVAVSIRDVRRQRD